MNNIANNTGKQTKQNPATFQPSSGWIEAKPKNPCPICGKKRWCSVSKDGNMAHCKEVASDHPNKSGFGWNHRLNHQHDGSARAAAPPPAPEQPKASAAHHDAVYTALLGSLELSGNHLQSLLDRGLNPDAITAHGYKSIQNLSRIVSQLAEQFDLSGVAGFFMADGRWQINLSNKTAGFFVPYRDENGLISGLQIRTDKGDSKYIWFSSKDKELGASSGTPVHFADLDKAQAARKILLTEGALKGDIIADLTGFGVCALAGTAKVPDDLPQRLTQLGMSKAVIGFDADFATNENVKKFIISLGEALMAGGIQTTVLLWEMEKGKGFDDYLAAGHTIAQEISFLDWRKKHSESSWRTAARIALKKRQNESPDDQDFAAPTTTKPERGAFHHYAEIASLLSCMMTLAGFSNSSQRFIETVFKVCGLRSKLTSHRDIDLAQAAGYLPEMAGKDETINTKSIQRWRKRYKDEADELNYSLIEIVLPEYNFETNRNSCGKYRINPAMIEIVEDALKHLYSISGYERSVDTRRAAVTETAKKFFRKMPFGKIGERGKRAGKRKAANEMDKLQRLGNAAQKLLAENHLSDDAQSHLQLALAEIEAAISLQQKVPIAHSLKEIFWTPETESFDNQSADPDQRQSIECPHSFKESSWTSETEKTAGQSADLEQKQLDTLSGWSEQKEDISPEPAATASTPDPAQKQLDTLSGWSGLPEELPEPELCSFCSAILPDGSITLNSLRACVHCHATAFSYTTLLSDPSIDYSIKRDDPPPVMAANLQFQNVEEKNNEHSRPQSFGVSKSKIDFNSNST